MKLNEKMVKAVDRLMTEWSSIIVRDMDDNLIKFSISDKVDIGAILPSGKVLENKNNNAFRSLSFAINEEGQVLHFKGYINTKNGINEYFELNSVYAIPLYKRTHFSIEMLEEAIKQHKLLVKKLSAI